MWFVLVLFIAILILGVVEDTILKKRIKSIPLRILVNGTRGKSSVARMLVAALNGCGIRTFGKTTGSVARFILPDLSEEDVPRKKGTRIVREHDLLFKKAVENECQAIVCECMAIREENQRIIGDKLVMPTTAVITNARVDHVDQMGSTEEDTAQVLVQSIGKAADIFTADSKVDAALKQLHGTGNIHLVGPLAEQYEPYLQKFSFPVYAENLSVVLEVCRSLGLRDEDVLEAVVKTVPDFGMKGSVQVDGHLIVNGFASNDSRSAQRLLEGRDMGSVSIIYNNRSDREFRLKMFAQLFKDAGVSDLVVVGDNQVKCRRLFAKYLGELAVRSTDPSPEKIIGQCRSTVICMGNIKGAGHALLDYCTGHLTEE